MKKILLLIVVLIHFLYVNIVAQNTHFTVNFQMEDSLMSIAPSVIDSITFSQESNIFYQNVWCGEKKYKSELTASTTLGINSSANEYYLYDKETNGVDAVVTNVGGYCFFTDTINSNHDFLAVIGNKYTTKKDYVLLDSAGFINSFTIDKEVYTLMYGNDSVVIYNNKKWLCNIPYDAFATENFNMSNVTRASILTRNPIFKLAKNISKISDYIEKPIKSAIYDILHSQLGGDDDGAHLLLDATDGLFEKKLNWLLIIEALDMGVDWYYFGDASITTLEPRKNSICNYDLGCSTALPSKDTPFYSLNAFVGLSATFNVFLDLKEDIIGGKTESIQREPLDDEIWHNFSNLNVGTSYIFEPRLEVEYSISNKAYWLSLGYESSDLMSKRRSIYGETVTISIGNIGCSVNGSSNETDKSADIECTYSNVPEGAQCGVKLVATGDDNWMYFANGNEDGNRTVTVSGLKPNTEYTYLAYVIYKGKEYPSWNGGAFTTLPPDISGTWTCTEEYYEAWDRNYEYPKYKDYSIELNKDGTVQISNDDSDYVRSSWVYKSNGQLIIAVTTMATQTFNSGFEISCTADSADNPTKFTGAINNWNFNDVVGYVSRGGNSVVLTR